MDKPGGMAKKYTFSGSVFFQRMKERNRYTTDIDLIGKRVASTGLADVFATAVV